MDNNAINKWLDDLARYFETRDSHGEDRAHWANVYNAENARKIKAALAASEAEVARLKEALRPFARFTPSSFFGDDDNEGYVFVLQGRDEAANAHRGDFIRARQALTGETDVQPTQSHQWHDQSELIAGETDDAR